MPRLRQQRLLDLRGDLHLLLHPRLLERLAVEPGILDRDRGLGGQRLERGAGGARQQGALLAAVEIEHADALLFGLLIGAVQIAHQAERGAQDVADAERHGADVHVGEIAVQQVGDDLLLAGREDLFWDLSAGLEALAGEREPAAPARDLELQLAGRRRQHDEAALGAGDLERRVHHQREHFVEHAARAESAQPFEQRGHLAQIADGRRRVAIAGGTARRLRGVLEQEHHLGAAAAAESHEIAVLQRVFGDAFAVDVGAVAAAAIAKDEGAALGGDFGVVARYIAAHQLQVVAAAAADRKHRLVDVDHTATQSVSDLETTVCHTRNSGS